MISEEIIGVLCRRTVGKYSQQAADSYREDCFVMAEGAGAGLAVETALWGYREIRKRRCYWLDKRLLLRRIFRSTNLRLWQAQKENNFTKQLTTSLLVCVVGSRTIWLGYLGNFSVLLFRNGLIDLLSKDQPKTNSPQLLGLQRLGTWPKYLSEKLVAEDILVLLDADLLDYLPEGQLRRILETNPQNKGDLEIMANTLLDQAQKNGDVGGRSICLIKKPPR